MKSLPLIAGLLVAACTALKPEPGALGQCSSYQEQIAGVWLDENGDERALFLMASNANRFGCFALLNAVPEWGVPRPSSAAVTVKRRGHFRTMVQGETSVVLDLDKGTAEMIIGARTLKGRVTGIR